MRTPDEVIAMPEARKTDNWNKEVEESGRWGYRSRKEILIAGMIILFVVGATVAGVLIGTGGDKYPGTKIDPATGKRVSAYELPNHTPIPFPNQQAKLDLLVSKISSNKLFSTRAMPIPTALNALEDASSEDPFVKAAQWVVLQDGVNDQLQALSRFALAVIYYENNGENWTEKDKWLTNASMCEWRGVECCSELVGSLICRSTDFYDVIELDLYKNNLTGKISEAFALFPKLQSVFLNDNELTGEIPGDAFAALPHLQRLYMQHNQLSGEIPSNIKAGTRLDTFYLQGNNLGGSWPAEYCAGIDVGDIDWFGVDCHKVVCNVRCCKDWYTCFYHGKADVL